MSEQPRDLFCATERSNNIAESKFGVLSSAFSVVSSKSSSCISAVVDSPSFASPAGCVRSSQPDPRLNLDFTSVASSSAAVAAAAVLSSQHHSLSSSHCGGPVAAGRLSVNGLLSQHTNTSNHSSLLPPLINIFTPITSFPFSQLLSAAPVTGNFNCVSSSTDETRRINFSSSSLNHPRPPPLSRNSLYSCANENVLCQYKNNNEAFECRENSSCNNSKSSTSSQQTNNPSSFFFHQQVSSHPGSNAHQQFFMSSRGRRPANTQTSSNQSDKANVSSKVKAASTSASKRTKRTAFSKQRLRHSRLISESSSSSSSEESETQSSVDTDLSSAPVSNSLVRSLRKRSRGCTPVSATQNSNKGDSISQPVNSSTSNKASAKSSQQSAASSSSTTAIGSSISSRLRPRTSTARPAAVDSSADRFSPATTTNSSAPQSRNRSPLSQNLNFDITEIDEATLVFGNRVDTPESSSNNCQISEDYYPQLSPAGDQRLPKVPSGGKNSKKRKQKMKQNTNNNDFTETHEEAAPMGFNSSSVAGRLRSKKKSSKPANTCTPSNAAYSGTNSSTASAPAGGGSCPTVIQNNSSKLAPPHMSQQMMPLMWQHPGVNANSGSSYDEASQLIVNPALQTFRDIPSMAQQPMMSQSSILPPTSNLNAVLPMNFAAAAPTNSLMAQLPPQFWGTTTATAVSSTNMGIHTSANANPLGAAGLHDPTFASFLPNPQISNPNLLPVDSSLLNSYHHPMGHFGHSNHQLSRVNLALAPNVHSASNQMPPVSAATLNSNHSTSSSSNPFMALGKIPGWIFGSSSGKSNSSSGHAGSKRSKHSNACHANSQIPHSSAARRWGSNGNNSNVNTTTVASSNASSMGNGPSMSGRKSHSRSGAAAASGTSMAAGSLGVNPSSTASSASSHHSSGDGPGTQPNSSAAHTQSSTTVSSASGGSSATNSALVNFSAAFAAGTESLTTAPTSVSDNPTLSSILIGSGSQNDDQSEITQLQALLESRGLPPQLFSAIGPRVSHLISRSLSTNSTVTKAQQLLEGLQSADESVQLQAAIEMCQLLVMGNEDTLAGFPTKQVVPALATLLKTGHNYDMMNHACRALTYMMEALPRSTSVVVDAVPALLEKVESIQCMDVAEQSLTALEMLSKRHHKVLLNAGALPACLLYIEFFSIPAQRSALTIAANCCLSVTVVELEKVSGNLPVLTEKLTSVTDKRSVENVVLCFSRMVDNCQSSKEKLTEIAGHGLLENLQQLLVVTPPVLSPNFVGTVVRMMSLMASENSCLAVQLLHSGIQGTITYLLLGSNASHTLHSELNSADTPTSKNQPIPTTEIEIMPKNTQELLEITCLIHDLMPSLPAVKGNLFEIDELLWNNNFSSGRLGAMDDKNSSSSSQSGSNIQWMWKDGRSGTWQPYAKMDNRMIEMAFSNGEEEITLSGLSNVNLSATYTIDFHAMQQINDETGTVRSVTRSLKSSQSKDKGKNKERKDVTEPMDLTSTSEPETDARIIAFQDDALCSSFIKSLFGCLYEIYSSSAGQHVKHKTLRSILRMLHMASPDVLRTVLAGFSVSSHIAHMLSSNDQKVVVCAIQMSYILIEKLPDIFTVYFKREGVMHQMQKLTQLNVKMEILNTAVNSAAAAAATEVKQGVELPSSTECHNLVTNTTVSESCATHLAALEDRASLSVLNAESYLSLSNESIHSNAFDDGSVPGVASAVTVNSYNEDSSPTLDADIVTSKDFGLGSKKKKPPPIPVVAPPSSSKRSRRAKSESAQTPDSPTVMGVSSPPHSHSILSRAIFGASGTPFRMNSANASTNTGQAAGISIGANYSFSHANSSSSSAAAGSSFPTQPIPVPSNKDSSLVPPGGSAGASSKPGPSSSSGGASGFFASLKPIRWPSSTKSCSSSHLEKMLAAQASSGALSENSKRDKKKMSAPSVVSNAASINREKIKLWIKEKAVLFLELYSSPSATSNVSPTMLDSPNTGNNAASTSDTLSKLTNASQSLNVKSNTSTSVLYPSSAKHSSKRSANIHVALNEDLNIKSEQFVGTLRAIAQLIQEGDASPFEVLHSGLVTSLFEFLTCETVDASIGRDKRLRLFCHVFLNCPKSENEPTVGAESSNDPMKDRDEPMMLEKADSTLLNLGPFASSRPCPLKALVAKLILCLHQLEQFSVRITDLEMITGGTGPAAAALAALGSTVSPSSRSGSAAIKFFNTHQLKCQLQRHPNCKGARQWKGGPVKIDPLAQMHAVEKFLVAKGLARDDGREEDYDSEDEIRDPFFAMLGNLTGNPGSHHGRHRLKLFIGQQEIPYDWTVYQAIRQHGSTSKSSPPTSTEVSTDDESVDDSSQSHNRASLWLKTHIIYYASVDECTSNVGTSGGGSDGAWCLGGNTGSNGGKKQKNVSSSSKNGNRSGSLSNSNSKPSSGRSTRNSEMLWADGIPPKAGNPLIEILDSPNSSNGKNKTLSIQDPSIEVLLLLRALHSINCYWFTFYQVALPRPAIALQEFYSSKIHSKTSRQLQDPLGVMTGNLPSWLVEIGKSFPYLLPFEAKSLLFYVTSFDRDRAMLRLQESAATAEGAAGNNSSAGMNSSQNEASDRVQPRLDRKKRVVTRCTAVAESGAAGIMLKEAESILNEFGSSRIVLELQFRDEVGSGLGPTLEWYTLISHQLMRKDLEMWRSLDDDESHDYHISADNTIHESNKKSNVQYVKPNNGLFPRPFGRYVKNSLLNKVKSRFRLLGKFLARALMDNRLVDLPLSIPFYKWLLGMEHCLTAADLEHIDPALFRIYCRLQQLVVRKRQLEADLSLNPSSLQLALESLTLDNSTVESLDLTFELPGYNIEMKKGGKDAIVTIHNLEQYLDLLVYWTLHEGVSKQMEALREGFESVFPLDHLRFFFPEDLDELFCGAGKCEKWCAKDIADSTKVDHGFTHESQAVKWFFDIICQYGYSEQRLLLQFITGSPRLPVGGFRSLNPQLTIVRKTLSNPDESPDDFLPSVMTCVNYFKLPDYSTREIMAARLRQAIFEGQQSFDLS